MKRNMPDVVSADSPDFLGTLEWVGMEEVELPVRIKSSSMQSVSLAPARAKVYVNLIDPKAKGIHMSRLFLTATEVLSENELQPKIINKILAEFLMSHDSISDEAKIELKFDFMTKRKALKSNNSAWRSYPVHIEASKKTGSPMELHLGIGILYSSTCPCSAALSRQLNQENFLQSFGSRESIATEEVASWLREREAVAATPHAQRSLAQVYVKLDSSNEFPFESMIDTIEMAVSTPVQAAVKREDEQEFARLNANNLMFSEDASRRIKASLEKFPQIQDFRGKVSHFESLHPHDAVSFFKKDL